MYDCSSLMEVLVNWPPEKFSFWFFLATLLAWFYGWYFNLSALYIGPDKHILTVPYGPPCCIADIHYSHRMNPTYLNSFYSSPSTTRSTILFSLKDLCGILKLHYWEAFFPVTFQECARVSAVKWGEGEREGERERGKNKKKVIRRTEARWFMVRTLNTSATKVAPEFGFALKYFCSCRLDRLHLFIYFLRFSEDKLL